MGRLRHLARNAQWWLLGGLAVVAFVLGFVGLRGYQQAVGGADGFWDLVYRDLQLFILESGSLADGDAVPGTLEVARLLAPTVGAVALLRVVATLFREQAQRVRLRFVRSHVVVCGLDRKGLTLVRSVRERGRRVVVIERDAENDNIVSCRSAGVPVVIGDATDPEVLRDAGVLRAAWVVVLCGDSGTNAVVAAGVQQLAGRRRRPLDCLVHVDDPRLADLLRTRYLTTGSTAVRLDFFNAYERGAQVLLVRHPFLPEDVGAGSDAGTAATVTLDAPHVLIVGLGRLGRRLVVQAARDWRATGSPERLRVTAIDAAATSAVRSLALAHPEIERECQVVPVEVDVASSEFEAAAFLRDGEQAPLTVAYVCLGDDVLALRAGLALHRHLRERHVPIVVRSHTGRGLTSLLRTDRDVPALADLHPFPLLDHTCDADLLLGGTYERLARALHQVYVRHREAAGWSFGPELDAHRRTDPALAPWAELPEPLRESNRSQAAHVGVKLAAVGCTLEEGTDECPAPFAFTATEVERLAEMEHGRWVEERRASGWRPGPRDPDRRRTPYLVPYARLPEDVKEYDRIFVRDLPRVLSRFGYRIVRVDRTSADRGSGTFDSSRASSSGRRVEVGRTAPGRPLES